MNPFEDDFDEFEPCPGIAQCRYQDHDFRQFTNTPEPLPLNRVRGGVVLIALPRATERPCTAIGCSTNTRRRDWNWWSSFPKDPP